MIMIMVTPVAKSVADDVDHAPSGTTVCTRMFTHAMVTPVASMADREPPPTFEAPNAAVMGAMKTSPAKATMNLILNLF